MATAEAESSTATLENSRRRALLWKFGAFCGMPKASVAAAADSSRDTLVDNGVTWTAPFAPLFCIAYVSEKSSENPAIRQTVARFPLVVVGQDVTRTFSAWRSAIREINPRCRMLGYQVVIEESDIPGPGHELLVRRARAGRTFATYPNGFVPFVTVSGRRMRIYDPRLSVWQEALIDACRATLSSYAYDGLFLDQCTVFDLAHPSPEGREEMRRALSVVLQRLRAEFPDRLLIANASENWRGLNGELCENRPADLIAESRPHAGQAQPRIDLFHRTLEGTSHDSQIAKDLALCRRLGVGYGAAVNYQQPIWHPLFDAVMASYR